MPESDTATPTAYEPDILRGPGGETPELVHSADRMQLYKLGEQHIPVVDGVAIFRDDLVDDAMLASIRSDDFATVRAAMLGSYEARVRACERANQPLTLTRMLRHNGMAAAFKRNWLRKLIMALAPKKIGNICYHAAQFNLYARTRFSLPSFWGFVPLLQLLDRVPNDGLVLDIPCGLGQLAYYLAKFSDPDRVVGMEYIPAYSYATRHCALPDARLVAAADFNERLPLGDDSCSAIYSADGFWHSEKIRFTASEFMRILHPDGVIVIPHLHIGKLNVLGGDGLMAEEYVDIFKPLHVRLFKETRFIEATANHAEVSLEGEDPQTLNETPAITLVASRREDIFAPLPCLDDRLADMATNPQPSGHYRQIRRGDTIELKREIPTTLLEEFPETAEMLPESASVPASALQDGRWKLEPDKLRELIRSRVFVDIPDRF